MGNNKDVKPKEKGILKPKGGAAAVACEKDKKHAKEKEKCPPKPSGGAVVVHREDSSHVKEQVVLYKYERESFRKEELKVVQRGKDMIVNRKVAEGHRERVIKNKEAAHLIDKHKVRAELKAVPSLPAQKNHRLLLK